jgi:NAD(P) transhydrogenase subunit alpha
MGGAKNWRIDLEDQVVRGAIVLKEGELLWPPPRLAPPPAPAKPAVAAAPVQAAAHGKPGKETKASGGASVVVLLVLAVLLTGLGFVAPKEFVSHLTVFVLSCFVGWQVIWNVTPALHTPLMSVTNAISGIIIVGGMLQLTGDWSSPVTLIGAAAVLLATINITGGFLVTQRMLRMFQR